MKVCIIMPCYNEEKRIGETLKEYTKFFNTLQSENSLAYELFIIVNNTKDRSVEIIKNLQKTEKNIRYLNLVPGGKGFAIIEGFKDAIHKNFDYIGFVDADMATKPDAFFELITELKKRKLGGVIASRYIPGAKVHPPPSMARRLVSRIFNVYIRALFMMPYRDTQCGAKVFTKQAVVKSLPHLTLSQWAFDVDLLYCMRRKGYLIVEHPTVWSDRAYSKINFMKAGPMMALALVRLRILNSPFKRFIRIYDYGLRLAKKRI